jgi:hypothetical protein
MDDAMPTAACGAHPAALLDVQFDEVADPCDPFGVGADARRVEAGAARGVRERDAVPVHQRPGGIRIRGAGHQARPEAG